MGVNGLTPFLQKTCPSVLKRLPTRFEALRGKRLIIDGTLITQRFHFAPERLQYRHVYGWYKLARELEEHGVSAICIFDGYERSPAKARELERRKEARRLSSARNSLEQERFQRLHQAKEAVRQFESMDQAGRQHVVSLLSHTTFGAEDNTAVLLQEHKRLTGLSGSILPEDIPLPPSPTGSYVDELPETPVPASSPSSLAHSFRSLFLSYKANLAKLITLSIESSDTPSAQESQTVEDDQAEKIMTRSQSQLTVHEGEFWRDCAQYFTSGDLDSASTSLHELAHARLDPLAQRSSTMAESFARRTDAPTRRTYRESQEILTTMGITCIEAVGAIEAEALASSMVLAGLGDYVASEDMDVLVYQAPLIRNVSSRNEPLIMVSGQDVRTSLELSPEAWIDFALLLGTDFSQRIKNIGPIRAYSFIKSLGSIERIVDSIESDPKYSLKLPKLAYLAQVDVARMVFQTLPPVPSPESLLALSKDEAKVDEVLGKYGLDRLTTHVPVWYSDGDYDSALAGNYFSDAPYAP